MILSYSMRLACICLASFFLVQLIAGIGVSSIAAAAIRLAEKREPRFAARLMLVLLLLPGALAALVVAGLCVPSYLWLEPHAVAEQVRWELVLAGAFGTAVWALSTARGIRAIRHSYRFDRDCRTVSSRIQVPGEPSPVWVLQGSAPVFALAGIVRPRLVVSRRIVAALSRDQLTTAMRHERAHRMSRDNLKRLLVLAAPGILPFWRCSQALKRHWAKYTEWAADDAAVEGDSRRSLWLAEALVRVARMGAETPASLASSLLADGCALEARVERLLFPRPPRLRTNAPAAVVIAVVASLLAVSILMLQPGTLQSFHVLLEYLIQ